MPITTSISHLVARNRVGENCNAISHLSTQGFKREAINPQQIIDRIRESESNVRNAKLILEHSMNEWRHLSERLHFLLFLCNQHKAIEDSPR